MIEFKTDMDVVLVDNMGSDERICQAARVSTVGAASIESTESMGLIRYLMRNRHGSPFEHSIMTFRISTPIFVWREFMRHRIASYNEQSGRYMEMEPTFYIPDVSRKLMQTGKAGEYNFQNGSPDQMHRTMSKLMAMADFSWEAYQELLDAGIANEVARMVLPLNIFSTAYVTINLRSLMNFLSLRTKREDSAYPSYPQREIEMVAEKMERAFSHLYPLTHQAFEETGRVSP